MPRRKLTPALVSLARGKMPTNFPARIRAERARLGLSQEQAAELLGVGRGSYRQLEEDRRDPRLSTLVRLVEAGYRITAIAPELVERR